LDYPTGIAVDSAGNLYISDLMTTRIRKVTPAGIISSLVGKEATEEDSSSLVGKEATEDDPSGLSFALEGSPCDLAVDSAGNLYNAEQFSQELRKITPAGIISRAAGFANPEFSVWGPGGLEIPVLFGHPHGVTVDSAGNLYIAVDNRILKAAPASIINTVAGNGTVDYGNDAGTATAVAISPIGVAVDSKGNLYIAEGSRIRKVDASGIITTAARYYPPGKGMFSDPGILIGIAVQNGIAVDSAGNLYIADRTSHCIRKAIQSGVVTIIAGTGSLGFENDGRQATSAPLSNPWGVAVDSAGNLFISDTGNQRIRKVDASGIITTIAGNGNRGFSGDGGPAAEAQLNMPSDVAVDSTGNLYIADQVNQRIRKVTPAGIISTVAGNGTSGFSGDAGRANSAQLNNPCSVAVDSAGNLYIADSGNHRIRKVTPAGIIITAAGDGTTKGRWMGDYGGDGGPATAAQLSKPIDVAVDAAGNLYIADLGNFRIRKVSPAGIISTVAGNGIYPEHKVPQGF
jgi:trimeric autotransporter adhesin